MLFQQAVDFAIAERLEVMGIEFAAGQEAFYQSAHRAVEKFGDAGTGAQAADAQRLQFCGDGRQAKPRTLTGSAVPLQMASIS